MFMSLLTSELAVSAYIVAGRNQAESVRGPAVHTLNIPTLNYVIEQALHDRKEYRANAAIFCLAWTLSLRIPAKVRKKALFIDRKYYTLF